MCWAKKENEKEKKCFRNKLTKQKWNTITEAKKINGQRLKRAKKEWKIMHSHGRGKGSLITRSLRDVVADFLVVAEASSSGVADEAARSRRSSTKQHGEAGRRTKADSGRMWDVGRTRTARSHERERRRQSHEREWQSNERGWRSNTQLLALEAEAEAVYGLWLSWNCRKKMAKMEAEPQKQWVARRRS